MSGAWLFQRAMSARVNSNPSLDFINQLLSTNFEAMEVNFFPILTYFSACFEIVSPQKLGDPVLKPFLQVKISRKK